MSKLFKTLRDFFIPAKPLQAGVYHYQTPPDADQQFRLHLRVDDRGKGLLIVNAATVLHLNQTATEHIYHFLHDAVPAEAAREISRRYQIDQADAREDYLNIQRKIKSLITIPDLDPVTFLDFSRQEPYTGAIRAPYRLDCALTYQLPEDSNPELAPQRRVDRELNTAEWTSLIDKAWEAGIPQIIFTGGEPTTRPDLLALINHAEKNGQVTGLLTAGLKLEDPGFLDDLLQSGLDHLMFALSPDQDRSWKALQAVLKEDLFTTVHITILPDLVDQLSALLNRLKEIDANAVSLSVSDPDNPHLSQALAQAQTRLAELKIPLKWDLPVPYSSHNPVALELKRAQEQPEGAGKAWLYVEPDGDVLPAQGINQVLGNILREEWQDVWRQASQLHLTP